VRYADAGAWGLWHHSLLTGPDGRPEAWISHCIDVSKRRLAEDLARPIIYYDRAATCWQPRVKGFVLHHNSIYNNWRFEDVWLDR